MFSEKFNTEPDEDGEYFIDRDSVYFSIILNHLRYPNQKVDFNSYSEKELELIMLEIEFYGIETLKAQIPRFNVLTIGNFLKTQKLSNTTYKITKYDSSVGLQNQNSSIAFTQCKKWKVKQKTKSFSGNANLMVGMMNKDSIKVDGTNYNNIQNAQDRRFIHSSNGYKYPNQTGYGERFDRMNNSIIFEYKNGDLICDINGNSYGKAMTGLSGDQVPIIDVLGSADFEVEFLE